MLRVYLSCLGLAHPWRAANHLHTPWAIPTSLLDAFLISYPASRYQSALVGICVHSVQTIVLGALTLLLVLG